jgi:hypothetical protein
MAASDSGPNAVGAPDRAVSNVVASVRRCPRGHAAAVVTASTPLASALMVSASSVSRGRGVAEHSTLVDRTPTPRDRRDGDVSPAGSAGVGSRPGRSALLLRATCTSTDAATRQGCRHSLRRRALRPALGAGHGRRERVFAFASRQRSSKTRSHAQLPPGSEERFLEYGVMGLPCVIADASWIAVPDDLPS